MDEQSINNCALRRWKGFSCLKNTRKNILEKAIILAKEMTSLVAIRMEAELKPRILDDYVHLDEKQWWNAYYDFLFYLMHIADREAFNYLDQAKRDIFMNRLLMEVTEICCRDFGSKEQAEKFSHHFCDEFRIFQNEFTKHKNGGAKTREENLTYQFTKRIEEKLGLKNGPIITMPIYWFVDSTEVTINLPCLLNDKTE